MHDQFEEKELSDSELEAANISGGVAGHHHGFGFGRGFGFGGLGLGLGLGLGGGVLLGGGGVPVLLGGSSGSCGGATTFVEAPQPQVVEVVQQPTVQTVQTSGTSYQLVSTGGC